MVAVFTHASILGQWPWRSLRPNLGKLPKHYMRILEIKYRRFVKIYVYMESSLACWATNLPWCKSVESMLPWLLEQRASKNEAPLVTAEFWRFTRVTPSFQLAAKILITVLKFHHINILLWCHLFIANVKELTWYLALTWGKALQNEINASIYWSPNL